MKKFVNKLSMMALLVFAVVALVSCGDNKKPADNVEVTVDGLASTLEFNTGDEFSEAIVLEGVTVTGTDGKSYLDKVVLSGLSAIPVEDGKLTQSGTYTCRLDVKIDGKSVATEMFTVKVNYVKPDTDDLIANGDFSSGNKDPFVVTAVEGGSGTLSVENGELKLVIDTVGWTQAFPRVDYSDFELENGKFYEVSFKARAAVARTIYVQVGQLFLEAPWFIDADPVDRYFNLTTTMTTYSFRFKANAELGADLSKLSLLFNFGTMNNGGVSVATEVFLDDIAVNEVASLGADTSAPTITAPATVNANVGDEVVISCSAVDDQDASPIVTTNADTVIPQSNGRYTTEGTYTVTVTARDAAGNESTKDVVVKVKAAILPGQNLIANGDFSSTDLSDYTIWYETWLTLLTKVVDNELVVTLEGIANSNFEQQIKSENLPIQAGKSYKLTVTLRSSINRKAQLLVQNDQSWELHCDHVVELTSTNQTFEWTFTAVPASENVFFGLMLGKIEENTYGENHTVTVSNISLVEVQ